MVFVVLEDVRAPIFSKSTISKFPNSSIVRVYKKSKILDLKHLESRPLLTDKWLVLADKKIEMVTLKYLCSLPNVIVVYYTESINSKRDYALCKSYCSEVEYIDAVNLGKEPSIKWILENLNTDTDTAEYLFNRCNGFFPYISQATSLLSSLDEVISKNVVNKYIQKHLNVTINSLVYELLEVRHIPEKILVEYLYSYRYAFDYLHKGIKSLLSVTKILYKDIEIGNLSNDNVQDYYQSNRTLNVSLYFIKTIVTEVYPKLSYGDLTLKVIMVEKAKDNLSLLSIL